MLLAQDKHNNVHRWGIEREKKKRKKLNEENLKIKCEQCLGEEWKGWSIKINYKVKEKKVGKIWWACQLNTIGIGDKTIKEKNREIGKYRKMKWNKEKKKSRNHRKNSIEEEKRL